MEIFAISGFIGGLTSFLFGVLILLKNPKSVRHRVFFLMTLSIGVWGWAYWMWLANVNTAEQAIFYVRLLSAGAILMPAFLFHWIILTTKAKAKYWQMASKLLYVMAAITAVAMWSKLLMVGVTAKSIFPYWPVPGVLYLPQMLLLYVLPVSVSIIRVAQSFHKSTSKVVRGGMLYVFFGLLLSGIGAGTNFFLWFDIDILPYGNFLIIALPVMLGYSMVKHNVFTAQAALAELLILLMNVFIFVRLLLARSRDVFIQELVFFIIIALFSYVLLKSIYREANTRDNLKNTVKKVKKLNKRLKELDDRKNEFLHIATHQLRGPITAINGYASLIKEGDYGPVSKKLHEPIENILSASKVMSETINDYMNIARIEEDNVVQNQTVFNLCELLDERAEVRRVNATDKGLNFKVEHKVQEGECNVKADRNNITQVLNALLENAIKYTHKGGVTVTTEPVAGGKRVRVSIKDTGIGVAKEEVAKLFDKFTRADNAKETDAFGTGMGLFIAKNLIEANGGKIWVESDGIDKGSTFVIELPVV